MHICVWVKSTAPFCFFFSIESEADHRLKKLHVVLPVSLVFLLGLKYMYTPP